MMRLYWTIGDGGMLSLKTWKKEKVDRWGFGPQ